MDYLNNSWAPVSHKILKDSNLRDIVDNEGLKKLNIVDNEALNALTKLFEEFHRVDDKRGGMFYSVYSKDINYRKQINKAIISILAPIFEFLFSDYRVVLASFVVKYPGPMSEFALHQDGTGVDELNFSAVSLWIPLQDVDINNGAMALIPYSHHFFSPYRHISIPTPFDKIQSRVKEYLQIQSVKKRRGVSF